MGNQQSIDVKDVCSLQKVVKKVNRLQKANLQSPSEYTLQLELNDTISIDGVSVPNVIWMTLSLASGNDYELLVHTYKLREHFLRVIDRYNISPNFLSYYAESLGCTFQNVLDVLSVGIEDPNLKKEISDRLKNFIWMVNFKHPYDILSPSSTPLIIPAGQEKSHEEYVKNFNINGGNFVICLHQVEKTKFDQFIVSEFTKKSIINPVDGDSAVSTSLHLLTSSSPVVWTCFLQLASTLLVMYCFRVTYNDSFITNSYIVDNPSAQNIRYVWEDGYGKQHTLRIKTSKTLQLGGKWKESTMETLENPSSEDSTYNQHQDILRLVVDFLLVLNRPLYICKVLFYCLYHNVDQTVADEKATQFASSTDVQIFLNNYSFDKMLGLHDIYTKLVYMIKLHFTKKEETETAEETEKFTVDDVKRIPGDVDVNQEQIYDLTSSFIWKKLRFDQEQIFTCSTDADCPGNSSCFPVGYDRNICVDGAVVPLRNITDVNWIKPSVVPAEDKEISIGDECVRELKIDGSLVPETKGDNIYKSRSKSPLPLLKIPCAIQDISRGLCVIGRCINKVISSYATPSDLPSETCVAEVLSKTTVDNTIIDRPVVVKIYLTQELPSLAGISDQYEPYPPGYFKGLEYESAIYEYLVSPIVYFNFNPHFIHYYGRGLDCSFANVLQVYLNKEGFTAEMPRDLLIDRLVRLSLHLGLRIGRPPPALDVSANSEFYEKSIHFLRTKENLEKLQYGFTVTEKSGGIPFNSWISRDADLDTIKLYTFMIQQLSTVVTMVPFKAMHQQLVPSNFIVEKAEFKGRIYTWEFISADGVIKQASIRIYSDFMSKLSGWERAYMESLGNNPYIETKTSGVENCQKDYCNTYTPIKDILRLLIVHVKKYDLPLDVLGNLFRTTEEYTSKLKETVSQAADVSEAILSIDSSLLNQMLSPEIVFYKVCFFIKSELNSYKSNDSGLDTPVIEGPVYGLITPKEGEEVYDMRYSHIVNTLSTKCSIISNPCNVNNDCSEEEICLPGHRDKSGVGSRKCCPPNFPTTVVRTENKTVKLRPRSYRDRVRDGSVQ